MEKLELRRLMLGGLGTNCYIVRNTETNETVIVDPADQAERVEQHIEQAGTKPVAVLLTHGHFDHIMAADDLRKKYEIPVYIHELDEAVLEDPMKNLSGMWARSYSMKADRLVKEGDILELAGFRFRVIFTPGHTQGGCCYYLEEENVLFSGDTLFCCSYGRVDFPTSSASDMSASVKRLLKELPDKTLVLPGHESETTIEDEKRYNPLA